MFPFYNYGPILFETEASGIPLLPDPILTYWGHDYKQLHTTVNILKKYTKSNNF